MPRGSCRTIGCRKQCCRDASLREQVSRARAVNATVAAHSCSSDDRALKQAGSEPFRRLPCTFLQFAKARVRAETRPQAEDVQLRQGGELTQADRDCALKRVSLERPARRLPISSCAGCSPSRTYSRARPVSAPSAEGMDPTRALSPSCLSNKSRLVSARRFAKGTRVATHS